MHISGVERNFFVQQSKNNNFPPEDNNETEDSVSSNYQPAQAKVTLSLEDYVSAIDVSGETDNTSFGEYTKDELKEQYKLTDRDIAIFFQAKSGKYIINQNAVKSCFGSDNIKTVSQLLDAMHNDGFSEGYVRGAYELTSEQTNKYLKLVSQNPAKYILNKENIQKDFPDKEINTIGQLLDAISTKNNVAETRAQKNTVGYTEGELRGKYGLSISEVEMFFTQNETGGYDLNQDAIDAFYAGYQRDTLEKFIEFRDSYSLGRIRMQEVCEYYTDALRNSDSRFGFDKLDPKLTEEEIQEFYNLLISLDPQGKKSLKELDKLIQQNLDSIKNTVQLHAFENQINGNELDSYATLDELNEYINKYSNLIKKELKSKYKYSDVYIEKIVSFAIENLGLETDYSDDYSFGGNIKDILTKLKNNIKNIISTPDLHPKSTNILYKIHGGSQEIDWFNDKPISSDSMILIIEKLSESENIQEKFFAKMFSDKIKELNLNEGEQQSFFNILLKKLGAKKDEFGQYTLSKSDFENLNRNNDVSWFDEIFKLAYEEFNKIKFISDEDINNAQTIDKSALFGNKDSLSAEDILNNYDILKLSDDPGIRKFIQMIDNAFEKYDCSLNYDKEYLLTLIFAIINSNVDATSKDINLNKYSIENLNEQDIFDIIEKTIDEAKNYSIISNEHYQGDLYFIENNNNVLTIKNIYTNKTEVVDLNKLIENLPENKKTEALEALLSLPAETLIDIMHESTFFDSAKEGTGGTYSSKNDNIHINIYTSGTITHESGHAFDHTDDGFWSDSEPFASTFKAELEAYIASGGTQDDHDYVDGIYTDLDGIYGNYCTRNAHEMFAECYTLIMLGSPSASDTSLIKEHFPKCLELVSQHLDEVRNSSDSYRRN